MCACVRAACVCVCVCVCVYLSDTVFRSAFVAAVFGESSGNVHTSVVVCLVRVVAMYTH